MLTAGEASGIAGLLDLLLTTVDRECRESEEMVKVNLIRT